MKKRTALVFMVCGALTLSGCGSLPGVSTFRTARLLRSVIKRELKDEKEMIDRKNKENKNLTDQSKEEGNTAKEKEKDSTAGMNDRAQKDKEENEEKNDLEDEMVSSYSDLVKFYDELLDMYESEDSK